MSAPARSLYVFGVYLLLFGVVVLVRPNAVLALFGVAPTTEPWLRVAGMFAVFFGYYYCRAARAELRQFFAWTVQVRLAAPIVFAALVVGGVAPPVLLLLGIPDALAAVWTAWAIHVDHRGGTRLP